MTNANISRTFGVEIETIGVNRAETVRAMNRAGVACEDLGYTHRVTAGWKIVNDGSVYPVGYNPVGTGFEVVSPILQGTEGFATLARALDALRKAGCRPNVKCGLHVHVGCEDMDTRSLVNVGRRYARFEPEIEAFMPRARIDQGYCKRARRLDFDALETQGKSGWGGFDRYHAVNYASFAKYGTLEFRQHSGTVSTEKVESWVRFCLAFVEASILAPGEASTPTTWSRVQGDWHSV